MSKSETLLAIAREFAGLLRARIGSIDEIIVFGSVARNEATDASDIDIAVIVDRKDRAIRELEAEAGAEIMDKHGALIGCVTYSAEEWSKTRRLPFGMQIASAGIPI